MRNTLPGIGIDAGHKKQLAYAHEFGYERPVDPAAARTGCVVAQNVDEICRDVLGTMAEPAAVVMAKNLIDVFKRPGALNDSGLAFHQTFTECSSEKGFHLALAAALDGVTCKRQALGESKPRDYRVVCTLEDLSESFPFISLHPQGQMKSEEAVEPQRVPLVHALQWLD